MEESEKMVALKKAYAEIILNTAKEAAARVIASERRALRCQRDLSAAKDDSLRLLLRLKKMIDAQECEAEINAIRQRRRIDELEAQLQVAEEKILDLRVELRNVSDEVENEKKNKKKNEMQLFSGMFAKEDMVVPEDEMPEDHLKNPEPIVPYSSDSDLENLSAAAAVAVINGAFRQSVQDQNSLGAIKQVGQEAVSPLRNYMGHSSELSSIIMRSAEPDLCKNGCTQRIRAFERQHLDVTVAAGEVGEECISAISELKPKAHEKDGIESAPTFRKASSLEDGKNLPEEKTKKPKLHTRRRRKSHFARSKSSSRRSYSHQLVRCSQASFFGDCNLANANTKVGEAVPAELSAGDSKQEGSAWLQEKLHNNNNPSTESKMAKTKRKREVVRRKSIAASLDASIKSEKVCLDISKDEAQPLLLLSKNTEDAAAVQDMSTFVKEQKLAHESRLAQKESDAAEVPGLPICSLDQEEMYSAIRNSNSEDAEGPSKAKDSRILKYTFHRKRKKDFSNNPGDTASPEKSNLDKLAMDREDVGQESKRSRVEPSRHSRRLAQVARQLISLSGKRW